MAVYKNHKVSELYNSWDKHRTPEGYIQEGDMVLIKERAELINGGCVKGDHTLDSAGLLCTVLGTEQVSDGLWYTYVKNQFNESLSLIDDDIACVFKRI